MMSPDSSFSDKHFDTGKGEFYSIPCDAQQNVGRTSHPGDADVHQARPIHKGVSHKGDWNRLWSGHRLWPRMEGMIDP